MTYYSGSTPELARILSAAKCVAGKRNSDVKVLEFSGPKRCNSYWDDGSRDEFALVELGTLKIWHVPESHPFYGRRPDGEQCGNLELRQLPPNTCLVEGGYFRGKPCNMRLHFRADNMAQLLPAPAEFEVSDKAKRALNVIRSMRGGYRKDEFTRASLGAYGAENPYVIELLQAKLVKANKAGALSVTTEGRNFQV